MLELSLLPFRRTFSFGKHPGVCYSSLWNSLIRESSSVFFYSSLALRSDPLLLHLPIIFLLMRSFLDSFHSAALPLFSLFFYGRNPIL